MVGPYQVSAMVGPYQVSAMVGAQEAEEALRVRGDAGGGHQESLTAHDGS
jgi:hypothetical protein